MALFYLGSLEGVFICGVVLCLHALAVTYANHRQWVLLDQLSQVDTQAAYNEAAEV